MGLVESQDVLGGVRVFVNVENPSTHGFFVSLITLTFPLFQSAVKALPSGCVSRRETRL